MKYLGCFECASNELLFCDPYTTTLNTIQWKLASTNTCHISVPAKTGIWNVFHLTNPTTGKTGLYLSHSSVTRDSGEEIGSTTFISEGRICAGFGKMLALVDKSFYNCCKNLYTDYDDDALFYFDSLNEYICSIADINPLKVARWMQATQHHNEPCITGAEVRRILGEIDIPTPSNLWSVDCRKRLENGINETSFIRGGLVSGCGDFPLLYRDKQKVSTELYIDLDRMSMGSPFQERERGEVVMFPQTQRFGSKLNGCTL